LLPVQSSDTWQLVINTGTTIVTFLMVFLIQNNQSRQGAVAGKAR
jgi:low affinity Fe/Cu permease